MNFGSEGACRRCGMSLAAAAPPMPGPVFFARAHPSIVDGAVLLPPGAPLPELCCKCGRPDGLAPKQAVVTWTSAGTIILAIAVGLLGVIFALIVLHQGRRTVTLSVPTCLACEKRWTTAKVIRGFAYALPFALAFLAGTVANTMITGLVVFLVTIIVFPIAATYLVVRPATIYARRIDEQTLLLDGFAASVSEVIARGGR